MDTNMPPNAADSDTVTLPPQTRKAKKQKKFNKFNIKNELTTLKTHWVENDLKKTERTDWISSLNIRHFLKDGKEEVKDEM